MALYLNRHLLANQMSNRYSSSVSSNPNSQILISAWMNATRQFQNADSERHCKTINLRDVI